MMSKFSFSSCFGLRKLNNLRSMFSRISESRTKKTVVERKRECLPGESLQLIESPVLVKALEHVFFRLRVIGDKAGE